MYVIEGLLNLYFSFLQRKITFLKRRFAEDVDKAKMPVLYSKPIQMDATYMKINEI